MISRSYFSYNLNKFFTFLFSQFLSKIPIICHFPKIWYCLNSSQIVTIKPSNRSKAHIWRLIAQETWKPYFQVEEGIEAIIKTAYSIRAITSWYSAHLMMPCTSIRIRILNRARRCSWQLLMLKSQANTSLGENQMSRRALKNELRVFTTINAKLEQALIIRSHLWCLKTL